MKRFSLAIALFITVSAQSQITIHSADLPMGDQFYTMWQTSQNLTMDLSLTGPNYNWDFSALTSANSSIDSFFTSSQVPLLYQFYFPGFNVAQNGTDINLATFSITDVCNMYKNSSLKFDFWGYGGTIQGIPAPFATTPHDIIYNFPLTYGDSDSSDSHTSAVIPSLLSFFQDRHRVNTVDGWGTVVTPQGSFPCVRVVSKIVDNDSVYVDALSFGINLPAQTSFEYKWLAIGKGNPVFQVNANSILGTPTPTVARWQDASNGIVIEKPAVSPMMAYPNPSDLFFSVISPTEFNHATINLMDISGKIIYVTEVNETPFAYIATASLPDGIYILEVIDGNNISRKKISVQH